MSNKELLEYLDNNSDVIKLFKSKSIDYLNEKNSNRPKKKKHTSERINREADNMVKQFIDNLYNQLKTAINPSPFNNREEWLNFFDENGVIENLEDSVADMEF